MLWALCRRYGVLIAHIREEPPAAHLRLGRRFFVQRYLQHLSLKMFTDSWTVQRLLRNCPCRWKISRHPSHFYSKPLSRSLYSSQWSWRYAEKFQAHSPCRYGSIMIIPSIMWSAIQCSNAGFFFIIKILSMKKIVSSNVQLETALIYIRHVRFHYWKFFITVRLC